MGARGVYGKSNRDGEAIVEGNRWVVKGEEKSNMQEGMRVILVE